jgi:hypothetical protein
MAQFFPPVDAFEKLARETPAPANVTAEYRRRVPAWNVRTEQDAYLERLEKQLAKVRQRRSKRDDVVPPEAVWQPESEPERFTVDEDEDRKEDEEDFDVRGTGREAAPAPVVLATPAVAPGVVLESSDRAEDVRERIPLIPKASDLSTPPAVTGGAGGGGAAGAEGGAGEAKEHEVSA